MSNGDSTASPLDNITLFFRLQSCSCFLFVISFTVRAVKKVTEPLSEPEDQTGPNDEENDHDTVGIIIQAVLVGTTVVGTSVLIILCYKMGKRDQPREDVEVARPQPYIMGSNQWVPMATEEGQAIRQQAVQQQWVVNQRQLPLPAQSIQQHSSLGKDESHHSRDRQKRHNRRHHRH